MFLHFLDHYVLRLSGVHTKLPRHLATTLDKAIRLSLLAADQVFVPAVSYFQSPVCRYVLRNFPESIDLGIVQLVGDAYSLDSFFENRLREYNSSSSEFHLYSKAKKNQNGLPTLAAVDSNTTHAIHQEWTNLFHNVDPISYFAPRVGLSLAKKAEPKVASVGEQLENAAFVSRNVGPVLFGQETDLAETALTKTICDLFVSAFLRDLPGCGLLVDVPSVANIGFHDRRLTISYSSFYQHLKYFNPSLYNTLATQNEGSLLSARMEESTLLSLAHAVKRVNAEPPGHPRIVAEDRPFAF